MKISIEIDCSPEEARQFLGMPDLSVANEAFARSFGEKLEAALDGFDADALIKSWLPGGMPAMEQLQKAFWEQFGGSAPSGKSGK